MNCSPIAAALIKAHETPAFARQLAAHTPRLSVDLVKELARLSVQQYAHSGRAALRLAHLALRVADELPTTVAGGYAHSALSGAYSQLGRMEDALDHAARSEQAFIAGDRANRRRIIALQINRVAILRNMGRYEEAINLANEARAGMLTLPEPVPEYAANLDVNVAWAYLQTDRLDEAEACYRRAAAVYLKRGDEPATAITRMNRAIIAEERGDFSGARELLAQAGRIFSTHGLAQEQARVALNLGILEFRTGRYEHSLTHLEQAFTAFSDQHNEVEAAVVDLYRSDVYLALNLLRETIRLTASAVRRLRRSGKQWSLTRATINLGIAHHRLGNAPLADRYLSRARRQLRRQGNRIALRQLDATRAQLALEAGHHRRAARIAAHTLRATTQEKQPGLWLQLRLIQARAALQAQRPKAADAILRLLHSLPADERFPLLSITLHHSLGEAARQQGDDATAWAHYARAADRLAKRRHLFQNDLLYLDFLADKQRVFAGLIGAGHRLLAGGSGSMDDLLMALNLAHQDPLPPVPNAANPALLAQWRELQATWHWHQRRQEELYRRQEEARPRRETPAALDGLEARMAQIHRRMTSRSASSESAHLPADTSRLSTSQLGAVLQPAEALIQIFVAGEDVYALAITPTAPAAVHRLGRRSTVDAFRRAWQLHLDQIARFGVVPRDVEIGSGYLKLLHRALVAPLLDALPQATQWTMVLPPAWSDLPLAAAGESGHPLCHRVALRYSGSLQRRLALQSVVGIPAGGRALVVGHSDDGRLTGVVDEVRQVAALLQNRLPVALLTEDEARLDAIQTRTETCTLLHIAAHALFRPDNPLFSWVNLADGRLTLADIQRWRLPQQPLVVLSACETGRGAPRAGGVQSLARGLLRAGARTLVVSQWAVEDGSTVNLLTSFYQHLLQGVSPARALQRAQSAMAGDHPFFWSGHIVMA